MLLNLFCSQFLLYYNYNHFVSSERRTTIATKNTSFSQTLVTVGVAYLLWTTPLSSNCFCWTLTRADSRTLGEMSRLFSSVFVLLLFSQALVHLQLSFVAAIGSSLTLTMNTESVKVSQHEHTKLSCTLLEDNQLFLFRIVFWLFQAEVYYCTSVRVPDDDNYIGVCVCVSVCVCVCVCARVCVRACVIDYIVYMFVLYS